MSRRSIPTLSLSLLDLLCCALGGVIIMSVVFAATIGGRAQTTRTPYVTLVVQAAGAPCMNPEDYDPGIALQVKADGTAPFEWRQGGADPGSWQLESACDTLTAQLLDAKPGRFKVDVGVYDFVDPKRLASLLTTAAPLTVKWWVGGKSFSASCKWNALATELERMATSGNAHPAFDVLQISICVPDAKETCDEPMTAKCIDKQP